MELLAGENQADHLDFKIVHLLQMTILTYFMAYIILCGLRTLIVFRVGQFVNFSQKQSYIYS